MCLFNLQGPSVQGLQFGGSIVKEGWLTKQGILVHFASRLLF